jgi:hypothetical protein
MTLRIIPVYFIIQLRVTAVVGLHSNFSVSVFPNCRFVSNRLDILFHAQDLQSDNLK